MTTFHVKVTWMPFTVLTWSPYLVTPCSHYKTQIEVRNTGMHKLKALKKKSTKSCRFKVILRCILQNECFCLSEELNHKYCANAVPVISGQRTFCISASLRHVLASLVAFGNSLLT